MYHWKFDFICLNSNAFRKQTWRLLNQIQPLPVRVHSRHRANKRCKYAVHANEMDPSKSKRSESRRSSILKPRKPRLPLQNVNLDSSSNENSPTASKVKRRVSFAEKKHVKPFSHSTEQGTVWDNTYEEQDFSLKGSFDQNAEAESNASNNDFIYAHSESNLCYPKDTCPVYNQLLQESIARASEEGNGTDYDLDSTNSVKSRRELSNKSHCTMSNKSYVSKDAVSGGVAHNDSLSDEKCVELHVEESQSRPTVITNMSESIKSNNIIIYRDSDEEEENVANKYSKLCPNNVNSELNKTHVQDLSMELTAPIFKSKRCQAKEQKEQEHNKSTINLDTTDCNNVSMEITEIIFAKPIDSNLGISEQVPIALQNYENTKWDIARNTTFSTNLQSNIVSTNISKCTPDVNCANDSMVSTSAVQPFTDVSSTGANNTAYDTSMEMIIVPSKMYEKQANNENTIKRNDLRKNQPDKTEIFYNVSMEITKPVSNILSLNAYNKENLKVDESLSRDDKTIFFRNVSMEMTTAVPSRKEITQLITCKSISKENVHEDKDTNNSSSFNEGNKLSMEFTEVVPTSLHDEGTFNATNTTHTAQSTSFSQTLSKTNALPAENSSRVAFQSDAIAKETIRDVSMEKDMNNTTCFNEGTKLCKSMEFTEVVPTSLHDEGTFNATNTTHATQSTSFSQTLSKTNSLPAENSARVAFQRGAIAKETIRYVSMEKDMNNSTCFNEGTKLCKSMEFTEVVPTSVHDEETFNATNTIYAAQSTSFSQTLSKPSSLPAENSARMAIANETIRDISMEITAAVPSTLLAQDEVNKTNNLAITKNNEFQHTMTNNNQTKWRENVTRENLTIREIAETENIRHDESSNVFVTQSPLDNFDHSLNTNLENASGEKKMSDENERSDSKRVCNSFMEAHNQSFQENNVHLVPSTSVNYGNNIECNEYFVKDVTDHTQVPDSNLRDSLNEISEYSFLKKSLHDSLVELQSIKPPSFVCLDSEEENSSREIQHELQPSTTTDIPVNNTFKQLTINNVTSSECLINSRENISNCFSAILRENGEPTSSADIFYNQAEDCHKTAIDKIDKTGDNQETNCQITKTIINDERLNESNYHRTKNINEESILSINATDGKVVTVQDIIHCASLIIDEIEVIDKDEVNERKCIRKRINEDVRPENSIEEKGQCLNKRRRQEAGKRSDHLKDTRAVIKVRTEDLREHEQNLNDEVKQQSMEQKDECATEGLVTTQYVSTIEDVENGSLTEHPFLTLVQKLETHAASDDCIWNVYCKNVDRKMIVFGFMSNSLLIATFLSYDSIGFEENLLKETKIISRISDESGVLIRIVHKLILEKIDAEILTNLYKTHQDILPILNFISQDVKLAMDFMFDLRRLDDLNLMEIVYDEISFVSQSKRMDIILRVTIKVKRFDKITPNDINLHCILGKIKEIDIKNLIINVKRDYKFLRRYMNDVKDYIDIMEETSK